MTTHGIVTYNAGDAVRLLTFGVRANGIFVFVMPLLNRLERTGKIHRQQHDIDVFHVVFDGVETLDQVEFIRSIGGTFAEGTLLSNAMNANEFLMRLETMGTSLPEAAPRQAE